MEIATGLVGLALTVLAIILGYIWRTNGRYMRILVDGQKTLAEGQKTLMEGQKEITKGIERVAQIAQEVHQGQAEMMKILPRLDDRIS